MNPAALLDILVTALQTTAAWILASVLQPIAHWYAYGGGLGWAMTVITLIALCATVNPRPQPAHSGHAPRAVEVCGLHLLECAGCGDRWARTGRPTRECVAHTH